MRRRTPAMALTLAVIATLCPPPDGWSQSVLNFDASKDNTLYEDVLGSLGNGSGDYLFAGRVNVAGGTDIRRGLIAFDIAGALPTGAFILDVSLNLNLSRSATSSVPVSLHRVLTDWEEGATDALGQEGTGDPRVDPEATWLHTRSPSLLWVVPGGDFVAPAAATTTVAGPGFKTWNSAGMVADVQFWLNNPAQNFGWLLRGNEATFPTAVRFDSRSHPVAANRPVLEVTYVIAVDIPAAMDNTLYEDATGSLSNGLGEYLFAGRNSVNGDQKIRRGLIQFDVAATIPAGVIISTAELILNMSQTSSLTQGVGLHRLVTAWGEGTSDAPTGEGQGAPSTLNDATWRHTFFPGPLWPTQGGDFVAAPSATLPVAGLGVYTWSGAQLTLDVRDMRDNPIFNFGWLLQGNETIPQTTKRFDSKDNLSPAHRPVLRVTYFQGPVVITGDVDVSGAITSSDVIQLVNHVFKSGPAPLPCAATGDVNCDGALTSSDIINLVNFVFKSGVPPCDVCAIIPAQWSCP